MLNAVGYARISRDEDRENYSSIDSQRLLIYQYASRHGINIANIYVDDNISGYTFERPGLKRIREELENPDIQIVIAKDLSRIGRHNALTLLFIEEVKKAGKRLILPDESIGGFDSFRDDDDIIGIKTWYNERYIKDISRKIRSSLKSRQENGTLIIRPYFGYKVAEKQKKLVVEEETASVVREIFRLYLEGNGYRKIAEHLNEKKYMTPSMKISEEYGSEGKVFKNRVSNSWRSVHIGRILKNDVYTGTLRLGKTRRPEIKSKAVKVPLEEQYVFENAHEAIIAKEDFRLVQNIISRRGSIKFRGTGSISTKNKNLFSGILFCGDCGEYMVAFNPMGKKKSYVCGAYHRRGKKYCSRHRIEEKELINHIKNNLMFIKTSLLSFINTLNNDVENKIAKSGNQENMLNVLRKRLKTLNDEYRVLVSQKVRDISLNPDFVDTIEENYKEMELDKLHKIKALREQIENMEERQNIVVSFHSKADNAVAVFDGIINSDVPSRRSLELTVKRINIYENCIEVQLNEDIDQLCEYQVSIAGLSEISSV